MASCPTLASIIEKATEDTILGKGAKGVVYKIDDFVLKKMILTTKSDVTLFKGEAESLHALSTVKALSPYLPNLCWTNNTGTTGYILQRYEPSITLQTLIETTEKGTFPFEIGYAIFKNLASALLHLLKAGYLHRDIKPENILIRTTSEEKMKIPILIDFGLACPIKSCDEAIKAGTPSYMVPNFLPPQIHKKQPKMTIQRNGTQKNVYVKTNLIPMYSSIATEFYALALTMEDFMPIINFTGHAKEEVEMRMFIEDRKKTIHLNTLKRRRNTMAQRRGWGPLKVVEGVGIHEGGKRRTQKKRRASR